MTEKPLIGGQAVIEGVMMKGTGHYAVSVRKTDGRIKTKLEPLKKRRFRPFKWPIIRGAVTMIDMLILGMRSLEWSANQFDDNAQPMSWKEYVILIIASLGFTIALFIVLPLFFTRFLTSSQGIAFNLIDGILRILIFTAYLMVIGLMQEVRRIFQYHGAEHKAVNCYEAGAELKAANAKKFSTQHPRCGTSFILIVLVLSIALFSLVTSPQWYVKFAVRIIFIPVIAGISYELLHYSAKHKENRILNLLIAPGLALQRLTTREPDDKQVEVALASLSAVLAKQR